MKHQDHTTTTPIELAFDFAGPIKPWKIIKEMQAIVNSEPRLTNDEAAELLNVSSAVVSRMRKEKPHAARIKYRFNTLQRIAYAMARRRNEQRTAPAAPSLNDSPAPATYVAPQDNVAENAPQEPETHTSVYYWPGVNHAGTIAAIEDSREFDGHRALTDEQRHELRRDINRALNQRQFRPWSTAEVDDTREIRNRIWKIEPETLYDDQLRLVQLALTLHRRATARAEQPKQLALELDAVQQVNDVKALEQARTARDIALKTAQLANLHIDHLNEEATRLNKVIGEIRLRELALHSENKNLRAALFDALRSSLNPTDPQGE